MCSVVNVFEAYIQSTLGIPVGGTPKGLITFSISLKKTEVLDQKKP